MDRETKIILLQIQLKNAVKLLDGTLTKKTIINSNGKNQKQIVITFNENQDEDFGELL